QVKIEAKAAGPMRQEFTPVFWARRLLEHLHHLEVLGAIPVGQDQEPLARRIVLQAVADFRNPLCNQYGCLFRLPCIDQIKLAGYVIVCGNYDVAPRIGGAYTDEEAWITFPVNLAIFRR